MPLLCPGCRSSDHRVVDKRQRPIAEAIYRRRRCEACGFRWSTQEITFQKSLNPKEPKRKIVNIPKIKALRNQGLTLKKISLIVGNSETVVWKVVNGMYP